MCPHANCKNGGTCDQVTGRCKCPKGFRGLNCQKCSSKPGCKNCHFDERRKEYTCEEKSCELKYIKEPPNFSDINCNPYGGNGYSLQCGVKVDRSLMNKVSINWKFVKHNSGQVDLNNPSLSDYIEFSRTVSNTEGMPEIYSTLKAKFDTSVLGASFKSFVFSFLKGGIIFCEASISDSDKVFMTTNYLTLPLEAPTNLPTCDNKVVYSTNTNHCAVATLSAQSDGMPHQSDTHHYSKNYEQTISSYDRHVSTYPNNTFQSKVHGLDHSTKPGERNHKKFSQDSEVKEKIFNFSHPFFHLNESGLLFKATVRTTTSQPEKISAAYISVITFMAVIVAILLMLVIVVPGAVVLYNIKQSSFHSKSSETITGSQNNGKIRPGEIFDRINSRAEQNAQRNKNRAALLKINSLTSTESREH